jgi:hypothetical protein
MEYNETNQTIQLQTTAEYIVVRHGISLGIDMLRRNNDMQSTFSPEDVAQMQVDNDAMPITLRQESLPFEITAQEGRLALCGIQKARAPEKPAVRHKRLITERGLKRVLGEAGVCFNSANG